MVDLLFDWFGIICCTTDNFCFYLQNRLILTSQTGGQWYNDTFPFSIPCSGLLAAIFSCVFAFFVCVLLAFLNAFLSAFSGQTSAM